MTGRRVPHGVPLALAAGLTLLPVWFLCRNFRDLAACYAYYITG